MQPNLSQLLVHNFKINLNYLKYFRFIGCGSNSCLICKFGKSDYFLKLSDSFYLPICCNSDCKSKGVLYIIKCNLCENFYYIGQTKNSINKE